MGTYVQYGAGWSAGEGWLNFDASPTLRLERLPLVGGLLHRLKGNHDRFPPGVRYGDILRGLPVEAGSVDGLYASHVLEHLTLEDMRLALACSLRLLRPGGVFRLIVPDLGNAARAYCAQAGDPEAAHRFMRATSLGRERALGGVKGRIGRAFGNSDHLWMYDYPAMAAELEAAGFTAIRAAKCGDSGDPMFDRVENPARFEENGFPAVAIEAKAPGN